MLKHNRYYVLDACRGIAAMLVAVFHYGTVYEHGAGQLAPNAFLAVDFFFALSGFVIDRTYRTRIRSGSTIAAFLSARIGRLYPMYLVGEILGFSRQVFGAAIGDDRALSPAKLGLAALFGIFILPSPFIHKHLFALHSVSWSIFLELLANIGFWFVIRRFDGLKVIAFITGAASIAYVSVVLWSSQITDMGQTWVHLPGGFLRTLSSFGIGVLISRLVRQNPRLSNASFGIVLVLAVALLICQSPMSSAISNLYGLAFTFTLAPLVVWLGASFDCKSYQNACSFLGELSYPLYMLHPFFIEPVRKLSLAHHVPLGANTAFFLAVACLASTAALYAYELPVRHLIKRRARQVPMIAGGRA